MRKLKIVVASDFYRPAQGGTETTTENLARGLSRLGHEVLVMAPGRSLWQSRLEADDGQEIFRVKSFAYPVVPNMRMTLWPHAHIRRQLTRFKPDVIHINNHFHLGQALIDYGKHYNIPVVAGIHFMPESYLFNVE